VLQIRNLFPKIMLAYWGTGRQLQSIVEVCLHNHLVLPQVVPFVEAEGAMYGVDGLLLP
jgi:hypothetical protein